MAEEQGLKSLKVCNNKKKEIIFPGVDLAGVDHQQQIEKLKKTNMSHMNNNNIEHIYGEEINYDEEIDQEELDGLL